MEIMRCTVRRQLLDIDVPTLVALTYDYINVKATFSSEWAGMQKWLHIRNVEDQSIIAHVLFNNDEIGEDVGLNLSAGEWDVWIHGALYEDNTLIKRITTNVKKIRVEATGTEDEILPSIGPSVAEQAVAAAEQAEDAAAEALIHEDNARNFMVAAESAAQNASGFADDAQNFANDAINSANNASNSAEDAEGYAERAEDAVTKYPYIDSDTKTWHVWDVGTQSWADTDVVAEGATFTPSVDSYGNLSWTNNAGLPNPATVNLVSLFDNVPELQARMDEILAEAEEGVADIEEQKNTILSAIAASAQLGTDTTLTTTGMAADAKATGDAVNYVDDMLEYVTGFSTAKFTMGGYYSTPSSGESVFVENADWCCVKIPHDTSKTAYAVAIGGSGNQRAYAFLKEDNTIASRSGANLTLDGSRINTTNADVRYIVINNKLSSLASGYYAAWADGAYLPTMKTLLASGIVQRSNSLISDLDTDFVPGYFSYTTSNHPAHSPTAVDGKSFTLINFSFTYESRSVQIIISNSAAGRENESFVMYRWKITTAWSAWVTLSKVGDAYRYWCYGKTINWTGDSIVSGADFDEEVSNALGMTETDYGISGSTIALAADGTDGRNAIVARYSLMSDNADIVAVSAGSNDWMYAWSPIGDMSSTDNTTFYGALKNLCEGLINKYPTKVIFFTTPIKRAQAFEDGNGGTYTADGVYTDPSSKNKYGKTLMDYCDIIKEVCGYYGIPVLDMNRESGMNPSITAQATLFTDKTHPNASGRVIMARRVAGWLTQLAYNVGS